MSILKTKTRTKRKPQTTDWKPPHFVEVVVVFHDVPTSQFTALGDEIDRLGKQFKADFWKVTASRGYVCSND